MLSMLPCRSQVSDRFPVASFSLQVPESRFFEVACATDPRLFHVDWQRRRTPSNFYTTRSNGLLRAPRGQTAWLLPSDQLRRFAGAKRIYFALGTYGNPNGSDAEFSISPSALDQVPSISLSSDFTGRSLDRTRLRGVLAGAADPAYGSPAGATLRWGGDDVLEAERSAEAAPASDGYDDGHSPELWERGYSMSAGADAGMEIPPDQDAYDAGIQAEGLVFGGGEDGGHAGVHDDMAAYDEGIRAETDREGTAPATAPMGGFEDAAALWDEEARYGAVGFESAGLADVADVEVSSTADTPTTKDGEPPGVGDVEDAAPAADKPAPPDAPAAPAPPPPKAGGSQGRDPGYQETFDEEIPLPAGTASRALEATALDIPEKVRVLRVIARAESGDDGYSAVLADPEFNDPGHPAYRKYHMGLSWGLIHFTQRSGALGAVLQAVKDREKKLTDLPAEHTFGQMFGPDADELLRVTNDADPAGRVAPVGGSVLWDPVWLKRFRAAGKVPHVTWAQNEVAITRYFDPQLRYARWLGFDTPRALAMLVDRCIHMGNAGGLSWVMRAVGPVQNQGDRDAALKALGHADLRAFQATLAPDLTADGRWTPPTHAALTAALRGLGPRSPLVVADRDTMLQKMVAAAASTGFAARLGALHRNADELAGDASYGMA